MLELRFRLRQGTLTAQLAHSTCTTTLLSVERPKFLHAFCSLLALQLSLRMADQEKFEYLVSLASQWAKDQEELILRRGIPLAPRYLADADRVGV